MHITQPFGLYLMHFHKACSLFTVAHNLVPIWGPSWTRYSSWPAAQLLFGIQEWEGSCGASHSWEVHGMECWRERSLLESVFCNWNPTRQLFHFVSPEYVSQEEFPALAIRKPKELQSVITREKQLLYILSGGIHVFSWFEMRTSSGNSWWDPWKQKGA